jgi:hypothetical protein
MCNTVQHQLLRRRTSRCPDSLSPAGEMAIEVFIVAGRQRWRQISRD